MKKLCVLFMLLCGCSNVPPLSCELTSGEYRTCFDYVAGYTAQQSVAACSGTWSDTSTCPGGRVAHCTYSNGGQTFIASVYPPYTLTQAAPLCDAAIAGPGFTADFSSN